MEHLIGRSIEDPIVVAAAEAQGEPEMEEEGDRTHFLFPGGVLWSVNAAGILTSIFLREPAPLPQGLTFSMGRDQVRERLGEPTLWHPDWDRFDRPTHCVHVLYGKQGLDVVTLMPPQPAPRMV